MPGPGYIRPKLYHWRVLFAPWLDVIRRFQGRDTVRDWLDWATSHAEPHGLEGEVEYTFWRVFLGGYHPSICADWALEDWDI